MNNHDQTFQVQAMVQAAKRALDQVDQTLADYLSQKYGSAQDSDPVPPERMNEYFQLCESIAMILYARVLATVEIEKRPDEIDYFTMIIQPMANLIDRHGNSLLDELLYAPSSAAKDDPC